MGYLEDLKKNQLLTESFYYVPGPDKMTPQDPLDDFTEEIFSEFNVTNVEVGGIKQILINLSHGEAAVGALVAASAIIAFASAVAISAIKKMGVPPECKKYSGDYRKKCTSMVKLKKQISALKSKSILCKNSKDPKACTAKVQAKIKQLQDKLKSKGPISGIDIFKLKKE
jgi:hypothetical protein